MSGERVVIVGSASVSLSERMQWKIPNFFTTVGNLEEGQFMTSADISSSGCFWGMAFDPKGPIKGRKVTISLICEDKKIAATKTVTCYVCSERANFSEEFSSKLDASAKIKIWVFSTAFALDELKRRKSELVPSDVLTVTFYVEGIDSAPPKQETQRLMGSCGIFSSAAGMSSPRTPPSLQILRNLRAPFTSISPIRQSEPRTSERTMSGEEDLVFGSASVSVSERIQWKIPDFFTTVGNVWKLITSPDISYSGCFCGMAFDPKGLGGRPLIYLLCGDEESAAKKTVTCYFGSQRADFSEILSSLVGRSSPRSPRRLVGTSYPTVKLWCFIASFGLNELKSRKSEMVQSDTFTITFYVEGIESDPPKQDIRRLIGLENLSSCFEDLFVSKKKTDATVKVKDKDFPVHKLVLAARSPVFSAMFGNDTSEVQTGVVTVPDCDPDSFQDFLHHLYTGKFDGVTSSNAHHLYVTADKYDVQLLKLFCVDHMKQNLTVENVLDVAVLADRYEESELLSAALDFFNHFFGKAISTSRWRTLMKEDQELAKRLLLQRESKIKILE